MTLTCHLMLHSKPSLNLSGVLNDFRATSISKSDGTCAFFIGTICCAVHTIDVAGINWEEGVPKHKSQLLVEMAETKMSSLESHRAQLVLAKLMTDFVTALNRTMKVIGILWRNFNLLDMETWNNWSSESIPTVIWVALNIEDEDQQHLVRTRGLDFFGHSEIRLCRGSPPFADDLEILKTIVENVIRTGESLVPGERLSFTSVDSATEHLFVRVINKRGVEDEDGLIDIKIERTGSA